MGMKVLYSNYLQMNKVVNDQKPLLNGTCKCAFIKCPY